jgi:hypothetical protein
MEARSQSQESSKFTHLFEHRAGLHERLSQEAGALPVTYCRAVAAMPQARRPIEREEAATHLRRRCCTCALTESRMPVLKNVGRSQAIQDFGSRTYVPEMVRVHHHGVQHPRTQRAVEERRHKRVARHLVLLSRRGRNASGTATH